MEITYNQKQLSVLTDKMHFLRQIQTSLSISTIIFMLFLFLGVFAIWMGFSLIGVIVTIIAITPVFVSIGLLATTLSINKMLKKKTYKAFRVKCEAAQPISGSPLWRQVKTQEGIDVYFYAGDPEKTPKRGETIDIVVHSKKKMLKFGFFSIPEN